MFYACLNQVSELRIFVFIVNLFDAMRPFYETDVLFHVVLFSFCVISQFFFMIVNEALFLLY